MISGMVGGDTKHVYVEICSYIICSISFLHLMELRVFLSSGGNPRTKFRIEGNLSVNLLAIGNTEHNLYLLLLNA